MDLVIMKQETFTDKNAIYDSLTSLKKKTKKTFKIIKIQCNNNNNNIILKHCGTYYLGRLALLNNGVTN